MTMAFTGTLDNLDGLAIRNEASRAWCRFNIFQRTEPGEIPREIEIAFSRNLLHEMQSVGLVGTEECAVRLTVEVVNGADQGQPRGDGTYPCYGTQGQQTKGK
jgi:hypothetical protein